MVKSKFPGKPSKLIQRTLVSAYSIVVPSYDTSAITEDVCHGLSVFDQIFGADERKEDFYGFTQSEICTSEEKMENFSTDVKSKLGSCESTYPPVLKEKQLHIAIVPLESCVSDLVLKKGMSETENAPLRRLKERNKCGKIWLLAKKNANRYLPKLPMRHNFKTLNKNSLIRFKHKPLASNYLTDKYCRKFTLPSRSLHSSRVIKPNKRFIDAEKNYESKWAVGSVEPFNSSMRVSSSKVIIREARLNITTEPAVAGPFSVKRNVPPDKDKLRSGFITCGICGALRHYKYILQTKKFGVFSCEPCRRFILRMIKQSKHFNGVCLECKADNGLGKCVIPIEVANKSELTDDSSAKTTRCEACWLSLCLQRYIIPSSLKKSLIKLIPDDLKMFLSSVLSVDLTTHLHLKSDTMNILVKDTNEKLSERFAANRFIKSVGSSLRTLERHDSSNPSTKSKVLRVKKSLSSQRLRPKNESVHESSGKDGGLDKSHYFPRGPRIKHVCRSALSVLRTSLITLNDDETDDGVYNSSESDSGRRLRKNSRNSDTKLDRQCQMNKVRQCDDSALAVVAENQNDAEFASQHYGARTLQDFGKDSSDESDENDEKLISTDFWEAYDPDEVFKTGFPLICSEPMNVRALCFLCGSAGVEKLLYCTSCCEPYHWYCAEGPSVFREDVELEKNSVNWICRKCKVCSTCGKGSDSRALTSCKRCRNSYHAECLNSKALNKRLFKSDRTWVCPSCLKCKSCNASSVFTHVGNIPLCSECFKLRQKGNYCPLCQGCYQDEDYNVQMMECGVCKCWIHAKCEGISHEKYQVLSFLPDTIEFVCRLCCSSPPAQWWLAVEDELKSGYLGILECLCKNKKMGDLLKESAPLEHACNCSTAKPQPADDAPPTEGATKATPPQTDDTDDTAVIRRPPTFALDRCVGDEKSPCVSERRRRRLHCRGSYENDDDDNDDDDVDVDVNETDEPADSMARLRGEPAAAKIAEPSCHCNAKKRSDISGRLLAIQANVRANQYASLTAFHRELEAVLSRVDELDWIVGVYREHLKQFFPWFDAASAEQPRSVNGTDGGQAPIVDDVDTPRDDVRTVATAVADAADDYETLRALTAADAFDYESVRLLDVRKCNLCKGMGEATPAEGGRLIYCGRNEWVHANCALWSSEVFEEIDGSLQNVHSAVSRGRQIRCSVCDKKGASVGCCFKNCTLTYHFVCAKRARCVFLQNKTIYCHGHQLRDATMTVVDEKDFEILRPVYVEMDRKKKRMECHTNVRLRIGSLHVERLGKIDPHVSDDARYILPIHFRCTRLFWSTLKPWRIVQYHVQIKVSYAYHTTAEDEEANYTVDHSAAVAAGHDEDAAAVVRLVLDELTSRACEATDSGAATPNADLLSPELQEAIYQDLPRDFLDDGTLHDMWNSYENAGSPTDRHGSEKATKRLVAEHELKKTKAGEAASKSRSHAPSNGFKCLRDKNDFGDGRRPLARQSHADALDTLYGQLRTKGKRKMNFENSDAASSSAVARKRQRHNGYISAAKLSDVVVDYYATYENLVQLDGMVDVYGVDEEPVKCSQCYRTYRTTLSFQRHLDTCNTDFGDYMISSCESDSASSEEEKCSGAAGFFDDVSAATAAVKVEEPPTLQLPGMAASFAKYSTAFVVGEAEAAPPPAAVGLQYAGNACADVQLNGNVYAYDSSGLQNAVTLQSILQNVKREQPTSVPAFAESSVKFEIVGDNGDAKLSSCPQEYAVQQFTLNEVAQPPTTPSFTLQNVAATATTATPTYLIQQYPKPEVVPTFVTIDNGLAAAGDRLPQLQLQPMTSLNFQPVLPTVAMVQQAPQVMQTPTTAYIVNAAAAPQSTAADLFAGQNNIIMAGGQPLLFGVETMVSNTVMSASHHQYLAAGNVGSSTLYSTTTTQFFQAAAAAKQLPEPSYAPGFIVLNAAGSAWQPMQQPQQQQQQIQQLQQASPVKQACRVEQLKQPSPVAGSIVSNNGDKYMYVRIGNAADVTPAAGRAKSTMPIIMKPVAAKPNAVAPVRKSIKVMKVKNNRPVAIQTVDNVIPLGSSAGQPGESKAAVRAVPLNKMVPAAGSSTQNRQMNIVDETTTTTRASQTSTSLRPTEAPHSAQQCYQRQRSTDAAAAARNQVTVAATNSQKPITLKSDTKEVAVAAVQTATRHEDLSYLAMPRVAAAAVTVASPAPAKVGKAADARLTDVFIDLTDADVSSAPPSSGGSAKSTTAVTVSAASTAAATPKSGNKVVPVTSFPSQKMAVDSEKPITTRTYGAAAAMTTMTTTRPAARSMPLIDLDPPAVDPSAKKVPLPPPVSETDRIFDELLRQHKLSLESGSNSGAVSATNASSPERSAAPNDEHLVKTCPPAPEKAVKDSGVSSGCSGCEVVAPSPPSAPAPNSKPNEPAPAECSSVTAALPGKSKYKPNVLVAAAARSKLKDVDATAKSNSGKKKKSPEKEKEKENVVTAAGQLLPPELEHAKSWKTASISYEVNAEDGFSYKTNDLLDLWNKILESVQQSRVKYKLPLLPKNVLVNSDSVYGLLGFENNASRYLLEQLPDAWKCIFYKPVFHKSQLYDGKASSLSENKSGCARTEPFTSSHKYDMFGWLASRHRKPPKFMLISDSDIVNGNRRITSLNLPMAMRFRHLKETAKETVGVFRSDIHGRGLFCLRDIDAGEMVIEYAGEVVRSTLTDKREKFYTSKGIGCYMFRIDDKYVVDATMCGNAARFINHSCDPNCYSRIVDILGKKHILIFALRRIPKGEELTYDYKFPLEDDKIHCHCLSRKCRKYLN